MVLEGQAQTFSDTSPNSPVVTCTVGADPLLQALEGITGVAEARFELAVQDVGNLNALEAIRDFFRGVNDVLDIVGPGLHAVDVLLNALAPHYDMTKSGEGVRIAGDSYINLLLGKAIEGAGPVLRGWAGKAGSGISTRLGTAASNLFKALKGEPDKSAVARQILARFRQFQIEVAEQRLNESIAKAVQLESNTAERAVNPIVNQIIHDLEVIARNGGDAGKALSAALAKNGYTGLKQDLTQKALMWNLRVAQQLNAFTRANMRRLLDGSSAILHNNQRLEVDHTVPFKAVAAVRNVLANLHYIPTTLNASIRNTITWGSYEYAELLEQAGYITRTELDELRKAILGSKPWYRFTGKPGMLKPRR
jgi:hypothetical protein